MNSTTAARIRKFKTADGAFLWQPGLVAGQPDTLLGYPVVEAEDMPVNGKKVVGERQPAVPSPSGGTIIDAEARAAIAAITAALKSHGLTE
jgi:hypothetical protein